ncbi:hypothetical protein LZQ00_10050 [Sphingobacterium sp. SRCM116780]|uniref:hypothetical protein n=1 Tax=Sphingobacterium sp. SRCM116780 TaxID=2907623 RepID=UPI001F22AE6D|nr:hypothetical protein [Sphingobacterium sp. SRCM116780]UIR54616.1 hypothetical protein LZQ00_10050 [Sphingobacterium sp. SRCM116780]
MLKSSALYLVLVISLIVSIVLGSMIYMAYFFRDQEARFHRQDLLRQQLDAGYQLVSSRDFPYVKDSLLANVLMQGDSIQLSRLQWGIYDLVTVKSHIQQDSLQQAALLGQQVTDSTVLYVVDEDRPLSVSGKTVIKGNTFLPKSGIRPSYVDGDYFKGYKDIVEGKTKDSDRKMPAVVENRVKWIQALMSFDSLPYPVLPTSNIAVSFLAATQTYRIPSDMTLQDSLTGNLILISDTTVRISVSSHLNDIIIIAPNIHIEKGFNGNAQFFASDSIVLEDQVQLQYPSTIGLITEKDHQPKMSIGNACKISGTVFLHEKERSDVPPMASFGKDCVIEGDMYIAGLLDYAKGFTIYGKVSCYRFLYKSPSSLYENFLVNITFDRYKRSPYFIGSYLQNSGTNKPLNKPIKWYHEI